jgi:hypothetical protein
VVAARGVVDYVIVLQDVAFRIKAFIYSTESVLLTRIL